MSLRTTRSGRRIAHLMIVLDLPCAAAALARSAIKAWRFGTAGGCLGVSGLRVAETMPLMPEAIPADLMLSINR